MRKPSKKTLKARADKLFSEYIRSIGKCEWCGAVNDTLQCAHVFSRAYLVTRWEPINANCLCASCHFKWHQQPVEAVEWVKEYLGEDVYDELRRVAKTSVKKIDLQQIIYDLQNRTGKYSAT
jgi:5-methylcytosine-specific restriction endonuclease McrA